MKLVVKFLSETAKSPAKDNPSDVSFSVFSDESTTLLPQKMALVRTGISFEPEEGHEIRAHGTRSFILRGIATNGAISNERGEMLIALVNHASEPLSISKGDPIAKVVVVRILPAV